MKNLITFQFESPWPAAKHWPFLVLLHRNVWTLSAAVLVFISNERNHSVFGTVDNKTAQTTHFSGNHSYRTYINIPIVSVCWRYRFLHGTIPIVETLDDMYVFVSRQNENTWKLLKNSDGIIGIEFCNFFFHFFSDGELFCRILLFPYHISTWPDRMVSVDLL